MIPSQVSAALATEVWNAKDTPHPPLLAKGEWRKRAFSVNKYESLNSPSECKGLHREEEEEGKKERRRVGGCICLAVDRTLKRTRRTRRTRRRKDSNEKRWRGGWTKMRIFSSLKAALPGREGGSPKPLHVPTRPFISDFSRSLLSFKKTKWIASRWSVYISIHPVKTRQRNGT